MIFKKFSMAIFVLAILSMLTVTASYGSFDAFLEIKGISGKSKVSSHDTDWTQILGMTQPSSFLTGSTRGGGVNKGNVAMGDITVTKEIDKASPKLNVACVQGQHFPEATLTLTKTGEQKVFCKIKMTGVVIMSLKPGTGRLSRMEQVKFKYRKLEWEYLKDKDDKKENK